MSWGPPSEKQKANRIKKGQVLNPTGRPKKVWTAKELLEQQVKRDLKMAAREHSPEALQLVLDTMRNTDASLQYRLAAANSILDRGWGKPTNQHEIQVDVYHKMSDAQLIEMITGKPVDAKTVEDKRGALNVIEHDPLIHERDDDSDEDEDE